MCNITTKDSRRQRGDANDAFSQVMHLTCFDAGTCFSKEDIYKGKK